MATAITTSAIGVNNNETVYSASPSVTTEYVYERNQNYLRIKNTGTVPLNIQIETDGQKTIQQGMEEVFNVICQSFKIIGSGSFTAVSKNDIVIWDEVSAVKADTANLAVLQKRKTTMNGANVIVSKTTMGQWNSINESIDRLVEVGGTHVLLCYPIPVNPDKITFGVNDVTLLELEEKIDYAISKGLTAYLKIHIDSGVNYANFVPANVATWFANYTAQLRNIMTLCVSKGITVCIINNELRSISNSTYTANWRTLCETLHREYPSVKLGTASTDAEMSGENVAYRFVDIIGYNMYPYLSTTGVTDTVEDLLEKWKNTTNNGDTYYKLKEVRRKYPGKQVWITEYGCPFTTNGLERTDGQPLNGLTAEQLAHMTDYNVMRKYYESVWLYLENSGLIDGLFFWVANSGHLFDPLENSISKNAVRKLFNLGKELKNIWNSRTLINRWIAADELYENTYLDTNPALPPKPYLLADKYNNDQANVLFFHPASENARQIKLSVPLIEAFDLSKTYKISLKVRKDSNTNATAQLRLALNKYGTVRKKLTSSDILTDRYTTLEFFMSPSHADATPTASDYFTLTISCTKVTGDALVNGFYVSSLRIEEVPIYEYRKNVDGNVVRLKYATDGTLAVDKVYTADADYYTGDIVPEIAVSNTLGTDSDADGVADGITLVAGAGNTSTKTVDINGQHLAITASTSGSKEILQSFVNCVEGDKISVAVNGYISGTSGTFKGNIVLVWNDAASASLGIAAQIDFTNTSKTGLLVETSAAPASTAKIKIQLNAAPATGATGTVHYSNLAVYKNLV